MSDGLVLSDPLLDRLYDDLRVKQSHVPEALPVNLVSRLSTPTYASVETLIDDLP
jgi:hypothetical protein